MAIEKPPHKKPYLWTLQFLKLCVDGKISDSEEEVWKLSNAVMGLSERQKIAIAREEKVHAHL